MLAQLALAKLHGSPLSYFSSFVLFCHLTLWFHSLPLCLWLPFPPLFFPVAASDLSAPKKCRARFGLDQQNNWCGPCRCVWCVHRPGPGKGWVIRPLGHPPPPHSVAAFPPHPPPPSEPVPTPTGVVHSPVSFLRPRRLDNLATPLHASSSSSSSLCLGRRAFKLLNNSSSANCTNAVWLQVCRLL